MMNRKAALVKLRCAQTNKQTNILIVLEMSVDKLQMNERTFDIETSIKRGLCAVLVEGR